MGPTRISFILSSFLKYNFFKYLINKIITTTPNSSDITETIKSVCASDTLFFNVPSPIPFPKNPPLIIASMAFSGCAVCVPVDGFINESILFLMYSNLGTKKIKHNNVINDAPKKVKKTNRLTPDIKIKDSQDKKTNKV